MSIEAAIDKTALKVAAIAGIKGAYGSGAYDDAVRTMTDDIPDTPIALVTLGDGEVSAGAFERLGYGIDVHVYFGSSNVGAAYKALAVFPARFIAAWRTDADLGQTVASTQLTGWSAPTPVLVNDKPFLVLVFQTRVIEFSGQQYSV